MIKVKHSLFIICLPILFSCGNSESEDVNNNNQEVEVAKVEPEEEWPIKGLREFSLEDYELNVTIYIPELYYTDEDDLPRFTPPEIIHNDGEARWEIKVPGDKRWHLVIEDMGKQPFGVEKELEEHDFQTGIFEFKYHQKTDHLLLYSKLLKSDNTTLDDKEIAMLPNFHFYCARTINGNNVVFRSHEMGDFRKPTVSKMLCSAMNAK
ncbi:MAG: hypothetical protein CL853_04005 [Crocinitomicaceae bacterium]|nr:hypothetical protein [Crocinitomicaceae bacterium]|tara:strand:- start:4739 stop:5362 length:624 start_codon:yes stop_codon:yes gene_type:complete